MLQKLLGAQNLFGIGIGIRMELLPNISITIAMKVLTGICVCMPLQPAIVIWVSVSIKAINNYFSGTACRIYLKPG